MMLCAPAVLVLVAVVGYPILQAVWDSLYSYRLTNPDARAFVGLDNYLLILSDPLWWRALGVTVLITVVTVAVELVLGFGLALVMNHALTTLRPALRTAILIPYAIITVVSAFAFLYMFDITSGFVNAWLPFVPDDTDWFASFGSAVSVIILSEIWKTTPFISLLLLSGLAQVPGDLAEAAKVDGATAWQRLWRVTIPNMKGAIMVALLFRSLDAFRIFDNIFIMTNGAAGTESVAFLAYRQTIQRLEIGVGSAVSVLLTILVALIAVLFVKGFNVNLAASTRGG
ncbi:sugar ABC transporter permease [Cellulomonas shaoxiangyii]|uniref:Sugar ABC transporter permease n=2 Tax=Cellulomonas shaoxiangyii TaxID=2566013 RepID=A0A4P7SRM0_9CELL|nr:sugar ABC transporter permease [Cellulomonas shaoxiangyii]TGY85217.1 sugar ABC transporter permease [Cellulomonas shaoxiangyii]